MWGDVGRYGQLRPLLAQQRPHLAPALAGDYMVALPESAALHKHLEACTGAGEKCVRDLASGRLFTAGQCGMGRGGQCGFHTRGR